MYTSSFEAEGGSVAKKYQQAQPFLLDLTSVQCSADLLTIFCISQLIIRKQKVFNRFFFKNLNQVRIKTMLFDKFWEEYLHNFFFLDSKCIYNFCAD